MIASRLLLSILLLTISFSSHSQLYKWVGPDGKMNYSDTPPPKSITSVEKKSWVSSNNNAGLPFDLAQAVKNMPVTLYTGEKCSPCEDGRNFLKRNGIPFSEKTVSSYEDISKFKQITGDLQLPALYIGRNKLLGFHPGDWRNNLTQAGYPETNKLPANYLFSLSQPLVPIPITTPTQTNVQTDTKPAKTDPPAFDPNAFRF